MQPFERYGSAPKCPPDADFGILVSSTKRVILVLAVENVAIIDSASIGLGGGFTALTGETGAGKSLLVDAIGLALGGRADSDLVRTGAQKGSVSLLADVSRLPAVLTKCTELGVDVEDGQLAVLRDVSAEGRSTVRLNGRPTSVSVLREIGALLVDLHGQHDHQALLLPERQIEFLDGWIGPEAGRALAEVSERFAMTESIRRKLSSLRSSLREREQRTDMLQFQIREIESVNPLPGEAEQLQNSIERLRHVERLMAGAHAARELAVQSEGSALERLGMAVRELEALSPFDPTVQDTLDTLRESLVALQEGALSLSHYVDGLEVQPGALEEAAGRLDALKTLFRKYGDSQAAVWEHLERAKQELGELTEGGASEDELEARLAEAEESLRDSANHLTRLRTSRARDFAELVTEQLRDLAMEKAHFSIVIEPKPVAADGQDSVLFLFTANPGESMRPLARVASGGEISRVMLAIKVASAGRAGVPTLIFDEVDTGIGGRAAAVMARKLEELALHYQVVVISHLPQIAARANTHYRIEKSEEDGRTVTKVQLLANDERVAEIARMLAGEHVGESALANARELVEGSPQRPMGQLSL